MKIQQLSIVFFITLNLSTSTSLIAQHIIGLEASTYQSFFIDSDQQAFGCGRNTDHQLAIQQKNIQRLPIPCSIQPIKAIASGERHTLFLKPDGTLWALGDNQSGQLGTGNTQAANEPILITDGVQKIEVGKDYSFFIKHDNSLWAMGNNTYGQLGIGNTTTALKPVQVAEDVAEVATSLTSLIPTAHTLILKKDGTLWACGKNNSYQLGDGTDKDQLLPVFISDQVTTARAGAQFSIFIKKDNTLWGVGFNGAGQLGDGGIYTAQKPKLLLKEVEQIDAGHGFTLAVKKDHSLWVAGQNDYGQLGINNYHNATKFQKANQDIAQINAGSYHTLLLKTDGTAWSAGSNGSGQLGIGPGISDASTFMQINLK